MTKRERVEAVYDLRPADRIPFVPAIYEHKGALIGKSPSQICRNADYLHAGLLKELEVYDADMLVIGIDVYNVEAEALGCQVVYFDGSNDCPGIVAPLIANPADLRRLGVPDPASAGRMPLYLDVANRLSREIGADVIVRGAVTGPYSMAAELIGAGKFVLLSVEDPAFAREVVDFCAQVTVEFGKAFLQRGVEPIVFDSRATPMLASPRVFRNLALPVYRDYVLPELKAAGGRFLPLIIGGNTTPIIDDLLATGATQFLSDHPANLAKWCEKALAASVGARQCRRAAGEPRTRRGNPPPGRRDPQEVPRASRLPARLRRTRLRRPAGAHPCDPPHAGRACRGRPGFRTGTGVTRHKEKPLRQGVTMARRAAKCDESQAPFCCPRQSHGLAPLPHGRGSVRVYYSILYAIGAATVRERSKRDFQRRGLSRPGRSLNRSAFHRRQAG